MPWWETRTPHLPKPPPGRRGPGQDCQPQGHGLQLGGGSLKHHCQQGPRAKSRSQLLPRCKFRVTTPPPLSSDQGFVQCEMDRADPGQGMALPGNHHGARCEHNHLAKESKTGKQKHCSWHASTSILIRHLKIHRRKDALPSHPPANSLSLSATCGLLTPQLLHPDGSSTFLQQHLSPLLLDPAGLCAASPLTSF